jgi:hypothetical protein
MRLFVVAGEASGDLHGANLLRAIKAIIPRCEFEGFGGERMEAAGMNVLRGLDVPFYLAHHRGGHLPRVSGSAFVRGTVRRRGRGASFHRGVLQSRDV